MKRLFLVLICITLAGCGITSRQMEPVIVYAPPAHRMKCLPSAFPPLSEDEREQEWATELLLGDAFARELDLYRAITCYKRAAILLPPDNMERRYQIDYDIIYSYYLGHKYCEAINIFEESPLTQVRNDFPAFSQLITIVYECYVETNQLEKAQVLYRLIEKCSPETAQDLSLYYNLKKGNILEAQTIMCQNTQYDELNDELDCYLQNAKSPKKARFLNALLPGAGYYYVGQKKSAFTSFVINALFTAAAYQFFHKGYIAAGAITTSLEAGWYFGGINGAGIEAVEYNTRLYEGTVKNLFICHDFFPVLMFETAF